MGNLIWFKLYLFTVVLATLYVATPPYFPIEISRCAASNPMAHRMFSLGMLILIPVYLLTANTQKDYASMIPIINALSLIGTFNDVDHYEIHMLGVVLLVTFVWLKLYNEKRSPTISAIGFAFYCVRFAIKLHALWFLENAASESYAMIVQRNFDIMFGHVWPRHPRTLVAFQFAGLFQWIFLGTLLYDM
jgi:hypothetical protein